MGPNRSGAMAAGRCASRRRPASGAASSLLPPHHTRSSRLPAAACVREEALYFHDALGETQSLDRLEKKYYFPDQSLNATPSSPLMPLEPGAGKGLVFFEEDKEGNLHSLLPSPKAKVLCLLPQQQVHPFISFGSDSPCLSRADY